MAWIKKTYDLGNVIEVEEGHNGRYGAPGLPRMKKKKASPEQIRKQNKRNRENHIRRKMILNFEKNDYWLTLTYKKDSRPEDLKEATEDINKLFRKLRRIYKARGQPFKWMLHTEVGSRGAVHHHIVMNRIQDLDILLRENWKRGSIHMDLLYEEGNFRKLASYLCKEPDEKNRLKESKYRCARGLEISIAKRKPYKRKTWKGEPKPPKGYYLEKETYYEGINQFTGLRHRRYTFIKLQRRRN